MGDFEQAKTIYYLESIQRNLAEMAKHNNRLSIGSEVLADNRDWLDCYIDKLRREQAPAAAQRDMQEVGG